MGKNRFKDDSYNPKYGIGGRVTKDDLSIDGKSWNYRDPANVQENANRRQDDNNPNSYNYTNPLYDYSYGAVRDASEAVNVTNVNSKGDVKQLLDYLQKGPEDKPTEAPKEAPIADKKQVDAPPAKPYEQSPELTEAKERVKVWENSNAGTDPSPFGGKRLDFKSMVFGDGSNSDASAQPSSEDKAQSQLEEFKNRLKERVNFQPVF